MVLLLLRFQEKLHVLLHIGRCNSVRLCIHLITMIRIMAVYEIQRRLYMDVLFCGIVTREMKVAI